MRSTPITDRYKGEKSYAVLISISSNEQVGPKAAPGSKGRLLPAEPFGTRRKKIRKATSAVKASRLQIFESFLIRFLDVQTPIAAS